MKEIQRIVEAHLDDHQFSVVQLCREAGISHPQLHRKLKARTGLSAIQFIRAIRMKKATQLLQRADLQITDVAYSIGFSDPDYFSKVFRKEFGCTPTQYRVKFSIKI